MRQSDQIELDLGLDKDISGSDKWIQFCGEPVDRARSACRWKVLGPKRKRGEGGKLDPCCENSGSTAWMHPGHLDICECVQLFRDNRNV
jgi:hypothetical protein